MPPLRVAREICKNRQCAVNMELAIRQVCQASRDSTREARLQRLGQSYRQISHIKDGGNRQFVSPQSFAPESPPVHCLCRFKAFHRSPMPLFGRSRSRSRSESSSVETPALPKTRPVFTSERRNILAAECRDLSAYYERLAGLDKFSSPEPSTKSSSSSSMPPTSPASQLTDSSGSSVRSSRRADSARSIPTSHGQIPSSRGGSLPSLQRIHNVTGDAPASPLSQWETYDVTSVDTAVNLLQGVASYHDVDRFIKVVRTWLKSLPRLNYLEAATHIRSAASSHFFRIWDPVSMHLTSPPLAI
ncbi:hypothetical protein DFH11DRAFT_1237502 [Phellopilus nigrolimitatus]|nr:hypothetical protein DFH11DRAFT_1237502 [Phellopilus nigrolimitatus]